MDVSGVHLETMRCSRGAVAENKHAAGGDVAPVGHEILLHPRIEPGVAFDCHFLLGPPEASEDGAIETDDTPEDSVLRDVIEEAKVALVVV